MNIKAFKKFITVFFVSVILLSFVIPHIPETVTYVIAATVNGLDAKGALKSGKIQQTTAAMLPKINGTAVPETTRKRPKGYAVEGAEYHDELWEKYSVIAAEDGGDNGKGGGASSKHSYVIGNKGEYDELGGVFGGDGGAALGDGGFGDSGSSVADAMRKLKAEIDASHAASIAVEIADRFNKEALKESIAESEKAAESIQRKLRQEAVKAKLNTQETPHIQEARNDYQAPSYTPDENANYIVVPEITIDLPTAAPQDRRETEKKMGAVIDKNALSKPQDALNILRGMTANADVNVPTAMAREVYEDVAPEEVTPVVPELPETTYYDAPVVDVVPEIETTIDKKEPIDDIESSIRESESIAESMENETTIAETEDDEGSNGGENPEEDVDKEGDADSEKKQGDAKDDGLFHFEKEEEYKGKKVFELDTVGNIGLTPDYLSMLSTKTVMMFSSILLFIIGAVVYFLRQRDKRNKKNYF